MECVAEISSTPKRSLLIYANRAPDVSRIGGEPPVPDLPGRTLTRSPVEWSFDSAQRSQGMRRYGWCRTHRVGKLNIR